MPEPEREWARLPDRDTRRLDATGISIRNIVGLTQYMVSGNLKAAARRVAISADGVGALELASGARYSVRLARDRLLVVCAEDGLLQPGWNENGYAVSGMSAALEIFELTGPQALEIVKRATALAHTGPSPCAATSFAGVTACVYRFEGDRTVRVHLDRGLAPYLWDWLRALAETMAPDAERDRRKDARLVAAMSAV